MPPLIWAQGLTKTYRAPVKEPGLGGALKHLLQPRYEQRVAVDRLDLTIEPGEAVACLGPNGAGKSTTIKMLTGILVPTAGELRIRGLVPYIQRRENARNISVVFGQRTQLWWDLPVIESLRLIGDIYEVPRERFRENLDTFVDFFQLGSLLTQPARSLSLGQRIRCDLVAALLHDPAILFLDEPTIGLDLVVKDRVRSFIQEMNRQRGTTIVLTSHDIGDIEGLCGRILLIDQGKLLFDGSREALQSRFRMEHQVHLALKVPVQDAAARCGPLLPGVGARLEVLDPRTLRIFFDPRETNAAALLSAVLPHLPVEDLKVETPGLQTTLRELYRRSETEQAS